MYIRMSSLKKYIHNGVLIPIGCFAYYLYTADYQLPIYMYLKLFSAHYYNTFKDLYTYPELYKYKHLVRLTDTGHIANFLYYSNPVLFLPISHNILFIITISFYIGFFAFNLGGTDDICNKEIVGWMQTLHMHLNHILPYGIIVYDSINNKYSYDSCPFTNDNLFKTYCWLYLWLFCVYIPWRYMTNDPVYSVLDNSTPLYVKVSIIGCVHIVAYFSNVFGYVLLC